MVCVLDHSGSQLFNYPTHFLLLSVHLYTTHLINASSFVECQHSYRICAIALLIPA